MAANFKESRVEDRLRFLPPKMRDKLMTFQKEGISFGIEKKGRLLIGDEMGLGKTLQALGIAFYYISEWPLLIVVPSSLRYPWIDEIEKWMPEIDPADISLIQSTTDIHCIGKAKISVVTYGLLRCPASLVLQEALYNQEFQVVILDESHYMKNKKSATSKFLVPLVKRAKHKILLTGTPALARPEELFPQLDALVPGMFGTWANYAKRYCDARWQFFGRNRKRWITDGASNLVELQYRLKSGVMIRRLKQDVLTQLPPKQRQRIPFEIKSSDIKKDLDQTMSELNTLLGKQQMNMVQMFDRVSPAGQENATSSFQIHGLISELYRKTARVKIGPVKEYVKMLCANSDLKFLIFGYHHVMMDAISEQLQDEKVTYIRIDGHTPQEDRPRFVNQFQADPNTRVAVLSIKAAGVGLTLTAASLVVFSELDWTPGVLQQCEDRAHRIGQKCTVHIHYLVARNTLDEWVWSALARKTSVISTTLNGKRQVLRMDEDKSQAELLYKADAYIIPENQDQQQLSQFFKSAPLPRKQRSLKEFFTPKSRKRAASGQSIDNSPHKSSLENTTSCKKMKLDSESAAVSSRLEHGDESITIPDSDDEESDDFKSPKMKFNCPLPRESEDLEDDLSSQHPDPCPEGETQLEVSEEDSLPSIPAVQCNTRRSIHDLMRTRNKSPFKKKSEKLLSKEEEEQWSCSVCTFLNHQVVRQCEMCMSPKTAKHPRSATAALRSSQKDMWHMLSSQGSPKQHASTQLCSVDESLPKASSSHHNDTIQSQESCGRETYDGFQDDEVNAHVANSRETAIRTETIDHCNSDSEIESNENQKSTASFTNLSDDDCDEDDSVVDTQVVDKVIGFLSDGLDKTPKSSHLTAKSETSSKRNSFCMTPDSIFRQSKTKIISTTEENVEHLHPVCSSPRPGASASQSSLSKSDCISDISANDTFSMEVDSDLELDDLPSDDECEKENSTWLDTANMLQSDEKYHNKVTADNDENCMMSMLQTPGQNTSKDTLNPSSAMAYYDNDCTVTASGQDVSISQLVADETAAANKIFASPAESSGQTWWCENCRTSNTMEDEECDGCFKPRPAEPPAPQTSGVKDDVRDVNLDEIPVYSLFCYRCSSNTSRIYLYNQDREPLHLNFVPLDVELDNYAALPDPLLHPQNLKLVKRFVREWKSLTETKQRVVVKSDEIFTSPLFLYDTLKSGRKSSNQRFTTKADGAAMAVSKAEAEGGSVRLITRPEMIKPSRKRRKSQQTSPAKASPSPNPSSLAGLDEAAWDKMKGVAQAVNAKGEPLCIECQKPYRSHLLSEKTIQQQQWATRFCSQHCAKTYWLKHHGDYIHKEVYGAEHGVCQKCGLDAADFMKKLKHIRDLKKRATVINASKYNVLSGEIREKMVREPKRGMFWQVDHITPVALGGGECDLDNLRTLCTVCHREVTANQLRGMAEEKKRQKRMRSASNTLDITSFFQPR